jgi:hypothetical protein
MTSRWMVAGLLAGTVGLVLCTRPVLVMAEACKSACTAVKSTADLQGKTALGACNLSCRHAANSRACRRSCQSAQKQARDATRVAFTGCRQSCVPANSCEQQCFAPARQCLAPILGQTKTCATDCQSTARAATQACPNDPNPVQCAADVAAQLDVCAEGCAVSARESAQACKATLDTCKAGCVPASQPPPPPCEQQCAGPLNTCLDPITRQARACVGSCVATAHDAAAACRSAADPSACFAQAAQQLAMCNQGCEGTAYDGAQACRATFDQCIRDCRPPDPCRDACLTTAETCLDPIGGDKLTCDNGCIATAQQAATDCLGQPNTDACLAGVAQQLAQCDQRCEGVARAAAQACRSAAGDCIHNCQQPPSTPPPPPGSSRNACLGSAQTCLESVLNRAKSCGEHCATTAYPAAMACLGQTDKIGCLTGVAQQTMPCAQDCKTTGAAAAEACGSNLDSCIQALPPDPCQDSCIGSLESCVTPVVSQAETCATGCMTAAIQAGEACVTQPNFMACLTQAGQQFARCGQGCGGTARTGVDACKGNFVSCQGTCGP